MRVCLISTENDTCPPKAGWGGSESMIADLAWGLHELGHEVSVVGRPGSASPDYVLETYPDDPKITDGIGAHYSFYKAFIKDFKGVVHDHSNGHCSRFVAEHFLHTVHWQQHGLAMDFKNMVAPSYALRKWLNERCPSPRNIPVVHHGISVKRFKFLDRKSDYYLFLSVMAKYKGAEVALNLARFTGKKFCFAGRDGDMTAEVKKYENPNILFYGQVDNETRANLLSSAKALVFPTGAWGNAEPKDWLEIFGLIQLEALASGTPCIVSDNGACVEIIEDGKVGFVCKDYSEMETVIAEDWVSTIKPEDCRAYCEQKFSHLKMSSDYCKLYDRVLAGETF